MAIHNLLKLHALPRADTPRQDFNIHRIKTSLLGVVTIAIITVIIK